MNKLLVMGVVALLPLGWLLAADEVATEPLLYDLVINGESFSVEANRTVKLESLKQPGMTYEVALRVAQMQRLALNSLQLDYDRGFQVSDDRQRAVRTATLKHELGFTMIVSDLGKSFDDAGRQQAFNALAASLQNSLRDDQAQEVKTSTLAAAQLPTAALKSQKIHYIDKGGSPRTSLVYVLGDARCTATCIVQFLDSDQEIVLPLVKSTLNTLRAR